VTHQLLKFHDGMKHAVSLSGAGSNDSVCGIMPFGCSYQLSDGFRDKRRIGIDEKYQLGCGIGQTKLNSHHFAGALIQLDYRSKPKGKYFSDIRCSPLSIKVLGDNNDLGACNRLVSQGSQTCLQTVRKTKDWNDCGGSGSSYLVINGRIIGHAGPACGYSN
jgi:hypothetical protein